MNLRIGTREERVAELREELEFYDEQDEQETIQEDLVSVEDELKLPIRSEAQSRWDRYLATPGTGDDGDDGEEAGEEEEGYVFVDPRKSRITGRKRQRRPNRTVFSSSASSHPSSAQSQDEDFVRPRQQRKRNLPSAVVSGRGRRESSSWRSGFRQSSAGPVQNISSASSRSPLPPTHTRHAAAPEGNSRIVIDSPPRPQKPRSGILAEATAFKDGEGTAPLSFSLGSSGGGRSAPQQEHSSNHGKGIPGSKPKNSVQATSRWARYILPESDEEE